MEEQQNDKEKWRARE